MAALDADRLASIERLASRLLFLGGIVALLAGMLLTHERRLPVPLLVAWAALLVVTKVVLAFLGLRAGWKPWPALLAEAGAFGVVGGMVATGSTFAAGGSAALISMLACATLLGVAGLVRRRGSAS